MPRRLLALAVVAVACFAAGCGSTQVNLVDPTYTVTATNPGCGGSLPGSNGATVIPISVTRFGAESLESLDVCIDHRGPYPFILDTGAATSFISANLAKRLKLPWAGPATGTQGAGCTSSARPAKVTHWEVAGLTLKPQEVLVQDIAGFGTKGSPYGLLGSDVWSRFGALRIDFLHHQAVVPGLEGPVPTTTSTLHGPGPIPTPKNLVEGPVIVDAPMQVARSPIETEMLVSINVGREHAAAFAPDTGSTDSSINTDDAVHSGLTATRYIAEGATVCSVITTTYYLSGRWRLAGKQLPGMLVAGIDLGPKSQAGFTGLLGSDVFSRYPSVVFDYAGGRLLLGAG